MQTRRQSIVETIANYVSGFIIAWLMNRYLLPLFGFRVNNAQASALTTIFTAVSVIRSYVCRRIFNRIHQKQNGTFENPPSRLIMDHNEIEDYKRYE